MQRDQRDKQRHKVRNLQCQIAGVKMDKKPKSHKVFLYGTLKTGYMSHFNLCNPENGSAVLLDSARTCDKLPLVLVSEYKLPFLLNKKGVGQVRFFPSFWFGNA